MKISKSGGVSTGITLASLLTLLVVGACEAEEPEEDIPGELSGVPERDLVERPDVSGITRTTLRDDGIVAVTRVHFDPGAAEPVHTHPFDLIVVPLDSGPVRWEVGEESVDALEVGEVQFVPAGVSHTFSNIGEEPFEVIAVALRRPEP